MNTFLTSKKMFLLFKAAFLMTVVLLLIMSNSANAGSEKITICHLPANDMDKAHTMHLPAGAAAAHVAHGDYPGSCQEMHEPPQAPTGNLVL